MDYPATYSDAYILCHASDMQLHIDTDASYLVLPKACSRIAGLYHLTNTPHTSDRFFRNGTILVEFKILRHVIASSAEAEVGGVFHDA